MAARETSKSPVVFIMGQGRSRLTPQEIDDLKKHTYCKSTQNAHPTAKRSAFLLFAQSPTKNFNNGARFLSEIDEKMRTFITVQVQGLSKRLSFGEAVDKGALTPSIV